MQQLAGEQDIKTIKKKTTHPLLLQLIAFIAVLELTVLVYWAGLDGPFVLDDVTSIVSAYIENPDWNAIVYTVTHNTSGLLGRSVSIMSFMLTEWQFGLNAWGYKFHNLLLHLANGCLLYRLLYLFLPLLDPRIRPVNVALTAGVTTSFWLLHPLLVSTVLYAVQRMVEMAVFFSLLALLSYFNARSRNTADYKFIVYGWILFPLTLVLAILSKETGVLVPVYILIIEFLVFKTTVQSLAKQRHLIIWLSFYVFIPMGVAALYILTHFSKLADYSMRTFTLYERLLTQLHVMASYIRSILFPRLKDMSLYQDDFPITQTLDGYTALLLGILVSVIALIWYLRHRAPVLAFGIAWFLGSHLLESTFVALEMVFEHRNYFGAMGLLLPVVYYTLQIASKELQPLRWFLAAFFVVFVGQTYSRVQEWSNTEVMLKVVVNDHPSSPRVRTEYANLLYNQGKTDEAIQQLRVAIELNPREAGSVIHQLALLCLDVKRHEGLLDEAETRLTNGPVSVYALNALTKLMSIIRGGQCKQLILEDVRPLLLAALSQPDNIKNTKNSGLLQGLVGAYEFTKGNYKSGVDFLLEAHELTGNIMFLEQLVRFQIQFKKYDDAEQTIAYMEQLNQERFGTETYKVLQLNKILADARKGATSSEVEMPTPVINASLVL